MTSVPVEEQLAIAVETLHRIANKESISDVQKLAETTLAKMGLTPGPADGLCGVESTGVMFGKCKEPWLHGGGWHHDGGMMWPVKRPVKAR